MNKNLFVKVLLGSSTSTSVKMIAGLISNKVLALILGPSGIALTSQFLNFISIITTFSTSATQNGVIKYISEERNDDSKQKIAHHAIKITIISSLILSIFIIATHTLWSRFIFSDVGYDFIIILFGLFIVLNGLNTTFVSILNGYQEYKKLIKVNIITSLLSLVITLLLVYFYNLIGALISISILQSIVFVYTFYALRNEKWLRSFSINSTFEKKITLNLFSYSGIALVSLFALPVAQLIVRNLIIQEQNITVAGLWDALNKVSGMVQMFIASTLGIYFFPKLSELTFKKDIINETLKLLKIIFLFFLSVIIITLLCHDFIISTLFSSKFTSVSHYLALQIVGDFFKMISWVFAYITLAKAKFKLFLFLETAYILCFYGSNYFLVHAGNLGLVYAYIASYFIYLLLTFFVFQYIVNEYK